MKINFRKQKYHALVEMLLVADCVTRGHEVGRCHASKRYDHLRKKVLSITSKIPKMSVQMATILAFLWKSSTSCRPWPTYR